MNLINANPKIQEIAKTGEATLDWIDLLPDLSEDAVCNRIYLK